MGKPTKRIMSIGGGHGTLNYDRICKICGNAGTILCDGGFETCINKECKSYQRGIKQEIEDRDSW